MGFLCFILAIGVWILAFYLDHITQAMDRIAKAYEEDLSIYRKQVDPTDKRK